MQSEFFGTVPLLLCGKAGNLKLGTWNLELLFLSRVLAVRPTGSLAFPRSDVPAVKAPLKKPLF